MTTPRNIILHAHLFKNAGTTFDWSLRRSFNSGFVDHRDDAAMKAGDGYLYQWLRDQPHCVALSSHWMTLPVSQPPDMNLLLCLFLRDPIERAQSVYRFERAQQGVDTPGSIKAKELSFADYVRWQLQPMPGPVMKNFQVRYCSGDYLGEPIETLGQRARELIAQVPLLGLVHRYDESMVLFEHRLRPLFPQLDLSYRRQNVTRGHALSLQQARAAVIDELGSLASELQQANTLDQLLFEQACERFDSLWHSVPDREQRLQELRERSKALADA